MIESLRPMHHASAGHVHLSMPGIQDEDWRAQRRSIMFPVAKSFDTACEATQHSTAYSFIEAAITQPCVQHGD